jgi:hypothetical protein
LLKVLAVMTAVTVLGAGCATGKPHEVPLPPEPLNCPPAIRTLLDTFESSTPLLIKRVALDPPGRCERSWIIPSPASSFDSLKKNAKLRQAACDAGGIQKCSSILRRDHPFRQLNEWAEDSFRRLAIELADRYARTHPECVLQFERTPALFKGGWNSQWQRPKKNKFVSIFPIQGGRVDLLKEFPECKK